MHGRLSKTRRVVLGWVVLVLGVGVLGGSPIRAQEVECLPTGLPAWAALPGIAPAPLPAASCGFCDGNDFCPETAVRCTFTGTCTTGPGKCCNYACQCDETCTNVTAPPNNACGFATPSCCACDPADFSPRFGVRCTYTGNCTTGPDGCCEYSCQCSVSSPNTTVPANACALTLPDNCCPGGHNLCPVSYCDNDGIRCVASGCGVGCCTYSCGPDASCTAPDPIPPEAC